MEVVAVGLVDAAHRLPAWVRPRHWGIRARSAFVSAAVVTVALTVAGAGLVALLYRSLLMGVDDAAVGRLRDVVADLQTNAPADLESAVVATDQRVVAVQVIDATGTVVRRSASAPSAPLVLPASVGTGTRVGMAERTAAGGDMRISAQQVDTPTGRYTVLVGAGIETVESSVRMVLALWAVAAPLVIAVSAAATHRLVGRSLRSVDAIRARVADISATDLTERVPVPVHRDEIAALATTMNEMLARIEAGHSAQRRFVADASHELRSPMATVISALEVADAHPQLLNHELVAATLLPEARRLQELMEDLLLLARADERALICQRGEVDLDDLVAKEATRLRRDTGLTVTTDLLPTRVLGDAAALSRVLRNLGDNAARHAASRVELAVRATNGAAVVAVADDGPGIPAAERLRVFDRFVRLDSDRARSGGGTGLGLAIVAEVVAAHGGSVRIDDRPGGGTIVVLQLPPAVSTDSSR